MKIHKTNARHWYYLVHSGLNVVGSSLFRRLKPKNRSKKVLVFYDQMNGNSKAFVDYLGKFKDEYEIYYLAFPEFQKIFPVSFDYVQTLNPLKFKDMVKVAQADAIIGNFGLQTLIFYQTLTDIKFIDVWHGVPYKGFTPKDFAFLNRYAEIWTSSPTIADIYVNNFGQDRQKVIPTGYARVDKIVNQDYDVEKSYAKFGLDSSKKHIMVAPTWKQNDSGRNIIPFNASEVDFLNKLDSVARQNDAVIIFRAHMQSGSGIKTEDYENIKIRPYHQYPDTEELLFISDVLVSDWSSIVFDFLPLHRPTIFLDVEAPFKNGFSLDGSYRFGKIVKSIDELISSIETYVKNPDTYKDDFSDKISMAEEAAYGNTLDGKSANRYHERLKTIL